MRTKQSLLWIMILLAGASCVTELDHYPDTNDTGITTRIALAIRSDSRESGSTVPQTDPGALTHNLPALDAVPGSRGLTPQEEAFVSNVHILIFDAEGNMVSNEHIGNLSITGATSVATDTRPGTNMQVWVIANGDVNDDTTNKLDDLLRNVTSTDQLKALLVTVKGNGLSRAERLTMVGHKTVTIAHPHTTPIPIQLHFLAAKVTVMVKDNTPADLGITITGWDVANIPKRTFLRERMAPTQEDAVTGTHPDDYLTTSGKYSFETTDAAAKTWTQHLYLFENRRGGRVDRLAPANPDDAYPGMGVTDGDQRGKGWYAPAGATCLLIYGTHSKDGQTNNIIYKVYLGENPVDDYNLFRGRHYELLVTINDLKHINVDSNVEWGSASFSVDHSDNLQMDAHPDFRVFRIGGTAVDVVVPAYATVEVVEADGVTPCTWLAVSPLNLYRHAVGQAGSAHQQFGPADGTGSYVRTKYTPGVTSESEFPAATFGMTRKLTKIPFNQPAVYAYQNIGVYADGYNGTADRRAKVRITYYKEAGGVAGERTYDLTQSGAIKVSEDLYVERYEESAMLMHPGLAAGLQNTTTMQWGYHTETLYGADDRFSNGNYLTANAIYNTVQARNGMDAPAWTATTYAAYREKYPRTGTKVTEPSVLSTTGTPYYYPELTTATPPADYFHPLFNASAARYCHEKNRDTNGDGVISANETVWYLPSFADLWYIGQHLPAELNLTGSYWTATEEGATNSWIYTFPNPKAASAAKSVAYRVRCVRGKGIVLPEATIGSTEADPTKINLAADAGTNGAWEVTDATGLTWTVASGDASWLEVATTATGAGAAASLTGTGNKTYYVYATSANSSTTNDRTAILTLTRLGMPATPARTITVTQAKAIPAATMTPTTITLQFLAGESESFAIDNKDTNLEWTVTSNQSWLTIATNSTGSDASNSKKGTANATLYAYASTANTSTTADRPATITLSRKGLSNIIIDVTQTKRQPYFPPKHKGWAGCNIYWDPTYNNEDGTTGRLTFDDIGEKSRETYQGVYFQFGSLVAVTPRGAYVPTTSILFSPNGVTNYAWQAIPIPPGMTLNIPTWGDRSYLLEVHNPDNNTGDICKYISDRGWAPGAAEGRTWRIPTPNEFEVVAGNYTTWGTFKVVDFSKGDNANGQYLCPSGIIRNGVNFPTGGARTIKGTYIDGTVVYTGQYGYYWSAASAYDPTNKYRGIYFRFLRGTNQILGAIGANMHVSMAIRCVQY